MARDSEAPGGWGDVRLGDIADIRRESFDPRRESGLPYVALEHIEAGASRLNGYGMSDSSVSTKTRFHAGDVLFGKLRPHLRKAVRVPFDGVCSTDILALFPKDGLKQEYLAQLAQWHPLQGHAITTSIGTKMPRTTWTALSAFRLTIPPPDEQARIAEVLDSIDAAIEKTEAVIAATERLRAALLGELLTRGVPGWHTEWKEVPGIGTIPACWEVVRLGDVLREPIRNGYSAHAASEKTGWWILTLSAVSPSGFDPRPLKPVKADASVLGSVLVPGDLLVSRSNTRERVGLAGVYRGQPANCSYPDLLMRVRPDIGRNVSRLPRNGALVHSWACLL